MNLRPFGDNVLVQLDKGEVSQGGIVLVEAATIKGRHGTYGAKQRSSAGVGGARCWGTVLEVGPKVTSVAKGDRVLTWYLAGEPLDSDMLERYGFADITADVRLIREAGDCFELVIDAEPPPTERSRTLPDEGGPASALAQP